MPLGDGEVQARVSKVETLLERVESLPDPNIRTIVVELVQALLELYGDGLERMLASGTRLGGEELVDAFVEDELVSHLLLLHGLHLVDLETRVQRALDEVRPYLKSHGGNVELLDVDGGVAHLRLQGSCSGCPSSTVTLKLAIEEAIHKAAPDLEGIEAENVAAPRSVTLLSDLRAARDEQSASWATVGGLPQLTDGGHLVKEIGGEEVLFLKLESEFFAYRPRCPGCGASLERGSVQGGTLTCAECGYRYDARRAGRCLDAPQVYLEPIPLLVSAAGIVKIALPSFVG